MGKCKCFGCKKEITEKPYKFNGLDFCSEDCIELHLFKEKNKPKLSESQLYGILVNPELLNLIIKEFDKKIIRERSTKIAIFISCCSIWVKGLGMAQHTLINSESSAGKSYITKKIYDFFPEQLKLYRTKISREAFTYWKPRQDPNWNWNGKILYLEDVSEDLINSPTFKVMCSEGSIAAVVRNQITIDIEIKGKPIILLTTANANPNTEMLNRFNLLSLDESSEQTHLINKFRSKIVKEGNIQEYSENIKMALNLLKRVNVKIPYAEKLYNHFPIENIRVRRDYERFLGLIQSSAALHQYQREKEDGVVLANEQDYEIARYVITKMQSNEMMIALTHKIRKAYESCIEYNKQVEWFSAIEAHTFNPSISQKMWYIYISKFLEMNLLYIQQQEREGSKKPVNVYKIKKVGCFELPKFKDL